MDLTEKYPELRFDHFVNMLDMNADDAWTQEVVANYIGLAIHLEGKEYYKGLLAEVELIIKK